MTCVKNMNRKLDSLLNEVNDDKHTKLTALTAVEEAFESLRKENLRIIKENIDLRERNKYLSLIVSDSNVKL